MSALRLFRLHVAPPSPYCVDLASIELEFLDFTKKAQRTKSIRQESLPLPSMYGKLYELHTVLGQGGYGIVYKAWNTRSEKWCAIKLIAKRAVKDYAERQGKGRAQEDTDYRDAMMSLEQEVRVLSTIEHKHIIKIEDVVKSEDETTLG